MQPRETGSQDDSLQKDVAAATVVFNAKEPMNRAISRALAVDILDGRWKPGSAVTLEGIQDRFGVSRTVARESAKTLESMHVVEVRRRVGLIAQKVSEWSSLDSQVIKWKLSSRRRKAQLLSLTQLRQAVEPVAAGLAAKNAKLDVRAMMPLLADEMKQAADKGDLAHFHELDIRFHSLLLKNSGNELFAALSDTISTILKGRVELGMYPSAPRPEAMAAHIAAAHGVWKGDPEEARASMRLIVEEVADALADAA
ncbi:MAG: FCD domain-containing protein [Bifidobacteriaceae bacterium]|jgi:DNA-binding FadR family transcriptional regulator|nr:FCD domain-containing protein [Bifidobacteriaceae bacterium]